LNVEATDAMSPALTWAELGSVQLVNVSQWYFDLSAPVAQQYYRAWQTAALSVLPTLDVHFVPALTLTGMIGGTVHIDGINQFGPTDAWFPLATVTLSNSSQLYFDISVVGKPQRLWRIVRVP
jgi:hypothetical protein